MAEGYRLIASINFYFCEAFCQEIKSKIRTVVRMLYQWHQKINVFADINYRHHPLNRTIWI